MLQLSRNLYKGIAGYSIGLQFEGSTYNFSRHCIAKSRGGRIDFEATEAELEENDLFSFHVRIPLLVGVQTPKRWLSLQTGLGLYVGGSKYEYRFKGRDEMDSGWSQLASALSLSTSPKTSPHISNSPTARRPILHHLPSASTSGMRCAAFNDHPTPFLIFLMKRTYIMTSHPLQDKRTNSSLHCTKRSWKGCLCHKTRNSA